MNNHSCVRCLWKNLVFVEKLLIVDFLGDLLKNRRGDLRDQKKCPNTKSNLRSTCGKSCSSVLDDIMKVYAKVPQVGATGTLSTATTEVVRHCGMKLRADS